LFQAVEDEGLF